MTGEIIVHYKTTQERYDNLITYVREHRGATISGIIDCAVDSYLGAQVLDDAGTIRISEQTITDKTNP